MMVVAVGCDPLDTPVEGRGVHVGALVPALVTVVHVRREEQEGAVAIPLHTRWSQADARELLCRAVSVGREEDFLGRIRDGINAVRNREGLAVLLKVEPVELHASEAFLVAPLEVGGVSTIASRCRYVTDVRRPLSVGAREPTRELATLLRDAGDFGEGIGARRIHGPT